MLVYCNRNNICLSLKNVLHNFIVLVSISERIYIQVLKKKADKRIKSL